METSVLEFTAPELHFGTISPLLTVALGAVLLPIIEAYLSRRKSFLSRPVTRVWIGFMLSFISTIFLAIALMLTLGKLSVPQAEVAFNAAHPMIAMDGTAHFLIATILLSAIMTILVSGRYLADVGANYGEYYALVLASVLGMMLLAASTNMIMLFVSLELMSIPIYALAGFRRLSVRSNESAMKYFIIGSFASGLMLYGMALLYGATGSVGLAEIGTKFDPESVLHLLGAGLLLIGLTFKIAAVPFHQWAPDVYEGAPTTVSGFMATAVKVAAFGALFRVLSLALQPGIESLYGALWVIAALSMTVGNVMAMIQRNVKRMLAYSSIAHAGYLLIGLIVPGSGGYSAIMFYLLVYTFMTIGAFTVISVLAKDHEDKDQIDDLAGLSVLRPFLAFVMAVCMFSLAGIPPFAGFMAKFQLFKAAIQASTELGDSSLLWLAIIGVLNSAVSLYYYLRIPVVMYMRDPEREADPDSMAGFERLVLFVCAAAVFVLGIFPHDVFVIFWDVDVIAVVSEAARSMLP